MEMDDAILSQDYSVTKINVAGSTQISKATTTTITKLNDPTFNGKAVLISLIAKARYANKLISIVEIAKRTMSANGTKCFQYNALSSELVDMPRKIHDHEAGTEEANDSDGAFETMGEPMASDKKKRAVPIMTTYLSTVSVKELKAAYGCVSIRSSPL